MPSSPKIYLGVDSTAGKNQYTWAVLDIDCQLVELGGGELEDITQLIMKSAPSLVAVNAPSQTNQGLLRKRMAQDHVEAHMRGADMRLCEHKLRSIGISVPPTPSRIEACPAWIQIGFALHRHLENLGYKNFPDEAAERQKMETNPHAVFCALIGQIPFPKPSLEGRLQRQSILRGNGACITDPMDFFEEITHHKLMHGLLPFEYIHTPEELDAIAAALTSWIAFNRQDEFTFVGDLGEGRIALPIKSLLANYH